MQCTNNTRVSQTPSLVVTRQPSFKLFPLWGEFKYLSSMCLLSSVGLFSTPFVLLVHISHPASCRSAMDHDLASLQLVNLLNLNRHLHPACGLRGAPGSCFQTVCSHRMEVLTQVWDQPWHEGPGNLPCLQDVRPLSYTPLLRLLTLPVCCEKVKTLALCLQKEKKPRLIELRDSHPTAEVEPALGSV